MESSRAKTLSILFAVLAIGWNSRAVAQLPNSLIVIGGGFSGSWDTDLELANPTSTVLRGVVETLGNILGAPCPPNCSATAFEIPPNGTIKLAVRSFLSDFYAGPRILRIETFGSALPVAKATVVNRERPVSAANLPVVHLATLQAADPAVLAFPGAIRRPGAHSNLFLSGLGTTPAAHFLVLVEVLSSSGVPLASSTFEVPNEGVLSNAFYAVDIIGRLGVQDLADGQIRVTKSSGTGVLTGMLATSYDDGRVSVTLGSNP